MGARGGGPEPQGKWVGVYGWITCSHPGNHVEKGSSQVVPMCRIACVVPKGQGRPRQVCRQHLILFLPLSATLRRCPPSHWSTLNKFHSTTARICLGRVAIVYSARRSIRVLCRTHRAHCSHRGLHRLRVLAQHAVRRAHVRAGQVELGGQAARKAGRGRCQNKYQSFSA